MAGKTPQQSNLTEAEKAAAAQAGMTEERYAALKGRTRIDEHEAIEKAEREGAGRSGRE